MADILIVDDEQSLRFTFQAFLEAEGHVVRTAESCAEGLALVAEFTPDLTFMDVLLPDSGGLALLDAFRRRGLRCPVIVITGQPSIQTAAEAVRLGAFDYVSKPVLKDNLLRLTRLALQHKRLADEKHSLQTEKERLRLHLEAVFHSVPDAIVTVGRDRHILQANQATEQVLGQAESALAGKTSDELWGERHPELCRAIAETLLDRTAVRERQSQGKGLQGQPQTLILNCSPLHDAEGDFLGAVLLVRDITRLAGLELALEERSQYCRLIGNSLPMRRLFDLLADLSDTETTVLITGESGTGKELVAEALHYGGRRAGQPLIKVNCTALSENLLESELFGHVRGAFTGAFRDKPGRFHLADKGTIFLDEIGDISPRLQLKLLRVLQEKEFERVGDTQTLKVDVRVIAATNQNLRTKVQRGEFREDLFYRLKVMELLLPPLRERRDDIPLLAAHFIEEFNRQHGRHILGVADEAMDALMTHPWPGNVREFKHSIEHAFILCRGPLIELCHLPGELRSPRTGPGAAVEGGGPNELAEALRRAGGNKAKAARLLGVSRQTLYRKLRSAPPDSLPDNLEP